MRNKAQKGRKPSMETTHVKLELSENKYQLLMEALNKNRRETNKPAAGLKRKAKQAHNEEIPYEINESDELYDKIQESADIFEDEDTMVDGRQEPATVIQMDLEYDDLCYIIDNLLYFIGKNTKPVDDYIRHTFCDQVDHKMCSLRMEENGSCRQCEGFTSTHTRTKKM